MTFKDGPRRSGAKKQRLTIFDSRRNKTHGVNWAQLNDHEMRTALSCAIASGVTLSFTPAAGGAGVMVKVYQGDYAASEFAGSIEEVNELLTLIVETYQSKSEDARMVNAKPGEYQSLAAD